MMRRNSLRKVEKGDSTVKVSTFDDKSPRPFAIHLEKHPTTRIVPDDESMEPECFKYPQMASMSIEERAEFEQKIAAT